MTDLLKCLMKNQHRFNVTTVPFNVKLSRRRTYDIVETELELINIGDTWKEPEEMNHLGNSNQLRFNQNPDPEIKQIPFESSRGILSLLACTLFA